MRITLACLLVTLCLAPASADPVGIYDASGTYEFAYGTAIPPTLKCSTTQVCVLRLQTGETIYDRVAGDTVHWMIGSGADGTDGATPLIFFEPLDTCSRNTMGVCSGSLTTNLIITTDKHTYEVRLVASGTGRTRYGFFYPREQAATDTQPFTLSHVVPTPPPAPAVPPATTSCLSTIDDYRIDAPRSPSYTPKAVCNDGQSTYIVMPSTFSAPSIYEILDNGQQTLVNVAPPENNIYVVPGLPQHVLLIGDVGKRVPHVDIWKLH